MTMENRKMIRFSIFSVFTAAAVCVCVSFSRFTLSRVGYWIVLHSSSISSDSSDLPDDVEWKWKCGVYICRENEEETKETHCRNKNPLRCSIYHTSLVEHSFFCFFFYTLDLSMETSSSKGNKFSSMKKKVQQRGERRGATWGGSV